MKRKRIAYGPPCCRVPRRTFLSDVGMGFAGLALGAMLQRDGVVRADAETAWSAPDGLTHFAPKAKRVIWVFLSGGYSHLETFDPKPALNKYAGKSFAETPFENPVDSPYTVERARAVVAGAEQRDAYGTKARIFPLQVGFKKHGESGIEVSDWLPHLGTCVDDLAVVRSMYTTDDDHAAENQIHTGRHKLDETQPSLGAWVHYGLGSLNDNLPQFVVLGDFKDSRIRQNYQSVYLGPEHGGIPLAIDPENPLPFGRRPADVLADEQRNEYELINRLNNLAAVEYPHDPVMRARIRSYELAYGMQMAVPEALDLATETKATQSLYGLDEEVTRKTGQRCLAARRLSERGSRFVLVYLSRYGEWDSHQKLRENHTKACARADKPVAGLLKDLKQRGMLDETLVVFCTEFGRTPALEPRGDNDGRDHHPFGFSLWLAGAGIKPGTVHGATDELGYHAVEHPHYVTDLHATVMHLLGLDPRRLDVPGRKRLEIDHGRPIHEILA